MNPCLSVDTQEACLQVVYGVPSSSLKGSRDEAPTPSLGQGGLVQVPHTQRFPEYRSDDKQGDGHQTQLTHPPVPQAFWKEAWTYRVSMPASAQLGYQKSPRSRGDFTGLLQKYNHRCFPLGAEPLPPSGLAWLATVTLSFLTPTWRPPGAPWGRSLSELSGATSVRSADTCRRCLDVDGAERAKAFRAARAPEA